MAQKNIIKRIIENPLVQTFLIYMSGGWMVLELTDYIINKYSLNEKISDLLPVILLIGLPVAIATLAILNEKINIPGVQIPIHKEIYEPILKELEDYGIHFQEKEVLHQ